jgi:putative cell wall-binding protein/peptidoglycan/xylan/chitin deacetylase (PgdA/CDA1 family)
MALLLVGAVALPSSRPPAAGAANVAFRLERLSGSDRSAVAVSISRRFFSPGVPVAFVVSGTLFPDGLTAGPAAAKLGGPVLFVNPSWLPAVTKTELQRLQPKEIVVVGGAASVSETVRLQLAALSPGGARRIGGADRYAVGAAVARTFFASAPVVYVATGLTFPDGLTAGAAAGMRGGLVLLVRTGSIPGEVAAELTRLHPAQIVVAGGTGSVSAAVEAALHAYAPSVVRAAGLDRYAAAVSISKTAFSRPAAAAFVTTGLTFPDALAGIPAAVRQKGPILLTRPDALPTVTAGELTRLNPTRAYLLGGTGSVPVGIAKAVQHILSVCWTSYKPPAGAQQWIFSIPAATNQVALTFDMGGRLDPAVQIMNFLVANQVCATIFPTGESADTTIGRQVMAIIAAHPELFEVGNHTMHHCDLVTGEQSATDPDCPDGRPTNAFIAKELTDAAAIISRLTGQDPRPYWRAPFGAVDATVRAAAAAVGYTKTFQWSIDTIDWSASTTTAQIVSRVLDNATSGSIVLMHLGGYNTLSALPTVVSGIRGKGMHPTALSDMLD